MSNSKSIRILGWIAFALGFFALVADNNSKKVDSKIIAELIESENDHFTVQELADSMIHKKQKLRLIDLRSPKEFSDYHIPNSENILIKDLLDTKFSKDETIILYSEGGIHAAQVWILLKEKNLDVYSLKGGLDAWKNEILFPEIPEFPNPEDKQIVSKIKRVSLFFGGKPVLSRNISILKTDQISGSKNPEKQIPAKVKKHSNYGC